MIGAVKESTPGSMDALRRVQLGMLLTNGFKEDVSDVAWQRAITVELAGYSVRDLADIDAAIGALTQEQLEELVAGCQDLYMVGHGVNPASSIMDRMPAGTDWVLEKLFDSLPWED